MININNSNNKKVKVDTKSYKQILIYYIGYETLDGVKPFYMIKYNKLN